MGVRIRLRVKGDDSSARERSEGAIEEVIRTGLLLCLEGLILVVLLLVLLLGLFVVDGVRAGCGERSAGLS
jgi:hypothetical protein